MLEALWFQVSLLFSLLSLVAFPALGVWRLRGRGPSWREPAGFALTAALAAFPVFAAGLAAAVLEGRSSTSAIGLVYVPFYAALGAGATALTLWSLASLGRTVRARQVDRRSVVALLILGLTAGALVTKLRSDAPDRRASDEQAAPADLNELYAAHTGDRSLLMALAGNPRTPPATLFAVARAEAARLERGEAGAAAILGRAPEDVLQRLAAHPAISPAALEFLARSPSELVVAGVARHPQTPPSALAALARHPSVIVLRALARNPQSAPTTLIELASHGDPWVRTGVAGNRSAPPAALAVLAGDRAPQVRRAVARHPRVPLATLETLAEDPDRDVRFAVAINPGTPRETLALLARDQDEKVSRYATQRLEKKGR